jgi:hypothetical protein
MRNIQIIDGAENATFSIFQATEDEFDAIFPEGRDIELAEDLLARLGEERARAMVEPMWSRPILKRDALGIHGTLFYGWLDRREHLPPSKREVDYDPLSVNAAQLRLFSASRTVR